MKKIEIGEPIALLMDINSPHTPFFANAGDKYIVIDTCVDPMMPSGYCVKLQNYGSYILIDKSSVVHYDDWKVIYNAVIEQALRRAKL